MNDSRAGSGYRPDIDGLRAIAVLAVIAYHAFPRWLAGGFAGVDIFFAISGFLITGIIRDSLAEQRFSLGGFYARRVRRIFPALVVVLVACWAFGWFFMLAAEYEPFSRDIVAGAAFVSNFAFWSDVSYFNAAAASKPLLHLWSLAIEEQFYILWPGLLMLLWRLKQPLLPTLLIAAASFAWCLYQTGSEPAGAFYSPLTRMWELLAGALLALGNRRLDGALANVASLAGVVLIALALLLLDSRTAFPGWRALLPVAGTCLLLAAGPAALLNRTVLARQAMVGIGLISYPLYLWHWPLLSFAYIAGSDETETGVRLAMVAASLVLAWATYGLIERPIRRGPPSVPKVAGLGVAMAAIVAIAAFTMASGGLPGRLDLPEAFRQLETGHYDYTAGARWHECWLVDEAPVDGYAARCDGVTGEGARPSLLLWGDSQAARLYPGLPPGSAQSCQGANEFVLRQIKRVRPQVVLMFGNWSGGPTDWQRDSYFGHQLDQTLTELAKVEGTRIVFLGPAPQWNRPLPRLLIGTWQRDRSLARPPERLSHGLRQQAFTVDHNMAAYVGRNGVRYVSLLALLCTSEGCRTHIPGDDAPITWNLGYFTTDSARFLVDALRASGAF